MEVRGRPALQLKCAAMQIVTLGPTELQQIGRQALLGGVQCKKNLLFFYGSKITTV